MSKSDRKKKAKAKSRADASFEGAAQLFEALAAPARVNGGAPVGFDPDIQPPTDFTSFAPWLAQDPEQFRALLMQFTRIRENIALAASYERFLGSAPEAASAAAELAPLRARIRELEDELDARENDRAQPAPAPVPDARLEADLRERLRARDAEKNALAAQNEQLRADLAAAREETRIARDEAAIAQERAQNAEQAGAALGRDLDAMREQASARDAELVAARRVARELMSALKTETLARPRAKASRNGLGAVLRRSAAKPAG